MSDGLKKPYFGSISIDYTDGEPVTYRGVRWSTRNYGGEDLESGVMASGDAAYDYYCALLYMENAGCKSINGSSSCDHFTMDGGSLDIETPGLRARLNAYLESIEPPKLPHDTVKFTIEVEMRRRWIPHFLAMLKYMQQLGGLGGSRKVSFMADGDGDFRPKFKWDDRLPSDAAPVKDENGDRLYDAG